MKKRLWFEALSLALIISVSGCKDSSNEPQPVETSQFTTATKIALPGCGNLYKVSNTLYRGEQPTHEGFLELEELGVKTVVNLRSLHSDRDELEGTSLGYEHIRMEAWDPELEQVEAFLKIATDPEKQPIFVHCLHGSDRTGTIVAVYRIVVEEWEIDKAIEEMQKGPFGFHEIFSGLPKFIKELDIESLRSQFSVNISD